MLYSFNMEPEFYHYTIVGPQVMACGGAVIAGAILTGLRMWKGRIVFLHFFLILIGSALFFLVAILSIVNSGEASVDVFFKFAATLIVFEKLLRFNIFSKAIVIHLSTWT